MQLTALQLAVMNGALVNLPVEKAERDSVKETMNLLQSSVAEKDGQKVFADGDVDIKVVHKALILKAMDMMKWTGPQWDVVEEISKLLNA